jgi:flagellar hook-associated protein 2
MATLQTSGVGSGLDINSIVDQLVAAERAPRDAQITRRESKATLQLSALGSLKGALSVFKTSLEALRSENGFNPLKAASSDAETVTATISGNAAAGNYEVEVVALAKAHQLASSAFPAGVNATVGTGTLTITSGDKTFDVVIGNNGTLAGIRDAINAASGNFGVQATLINETNGSRLVITSPNTGADGALRVTAAGGNGGLNQLVYNPGTLTNLTVMQAAQDAHIRIAGFNHFSDSNTVTGAVDGLTLNLLKVSEEDTSLNVSVAHDTGELTTRVKKFVTDYNALYSTMARLRSYTPATGAAGPLLGDALLRGIENEIRNELINPVDGITGPYTTLAAVGIAKQPDGTLKLDETKLNTILKTDRQAVAQIFGSEDGIAARLFERIDERLKTNDALDTRTQSLQKNLETISRDKEALEARMTLIEQRYRKQFTALDSLLASMQTTSSYLSQQLASLPGANSGG